MKHYIAALCTVLLALCIGFPLEAVAAGPALTTTEAYCIIDADTGLEDLLAQSANATLPTSGDLKPPLPIWKLAALSLGCTAAAAAVTYAVVRWMAKRKKKSKH